jgi:glycosyltransferase involved in cell wall biosynthesis
MRQDLRAVVRRIRRAAPVSTGVRVAERQLTEPTIYFVAPDNSDPSAGCRVIYRHVDLLHAAGVPAFALHRKRGFRYAWFDNATPTINAAKAIVGPKDLVVVPEVDVDIIVRSHPRPRHAVLDQSGYLTWSHDVNATAAHYNSSQRPAAIIATSEHIAELARFAFPHIDVRLVRLSVDSHRFAPGEANRPQRIVYMPRRGDCDADIVFGMLQTRNRLQGWEIRAVDGLREDEVAKELREARIFLAVSTREGLGFPPLEAMSSGCYVVGYHAIGGKEFMRPEFSSPVDVGNGLELARALESAITREQEQPGWLQSRGAAAAQFVRDRYTAERERTDVLFAYRDLLASKPEVV